MPHKPTGRPNGRPRKMPKTSKGIPNLTAKQWAAARSLIANPDASLSETAREAGVSRQAIHQFKADARFREGLNWLAEKHEQEKHKAIGRAAAQRLNQDDARREQHRKTAMQKYLPKEGAYELLRFSVMNDFNAREAKLPGSWSVLSMADGRTYTDPHAYLAHIEKSGSIPAGHLSDEDWLKLRRLQEE